MHKINFLLCLLCLFVANPLFAEDAKSVLRKVAKSPLADGCITSQEFVKRGLAARDAALTRQTIKGRKYKVVTFTVEDRIPLNESREIPGEDFWDVTYLIVTKGKFTAYINDRNLIEKVDCPPTS